MKKHNINMLEGPLLSGIISYSIPIILTSVLQLLFNAADLVVVGQFCGSISVAAVSSTGPLTALIVNLFIGLSVGVGVTVAHGLGSKEYLSVHRTVHTALPTALVGGVVLTVVGICFSETFLKLMGSPDNVLPLSALYMKIYFAGITFTIVYNFLASILRAAGDTKSPLIFLIIAGVVNVVLNVIFVTVLHMNVAGVALATTISQGISSVLVMITLMRRTDACKLKLNKLRFYGVQLRKIIRIGVPAGIQSSLFAISNVIIQSSINSFGEVFMSGNGAAANLDGFIFAIENAFHQTAVNYVGQNAGAHKYDRIKRIYRICLGTAAVFTLFFSALLFLFGRPLLSIYLPGDSQAIEYGMIRLTWLAIPYFICSLMDVSTGALRGLGSSFVPMVISVLGVCGVRILWIYTLFQSPQFHTPQCLYLSYTVSWIITFVLEYIAFQKVYRSHKQKYAL